MKSLSRRTLLGTTFLSLGLAGCQIGGVTLTPAAIVNAASTVAKGLDGAVTQVAAAYPALIPAATLATIQADLALAQQAARTLSATLPAATAATTVQTVQGYISAVLNLLAGPPINGLIPSPFNVAIAAAAIVEPQLEAFVAQYLLTASASPAAVNARTALAGAAPGMTADQALAVLAAYAK